MLNRIHIKRKEVLPKGAKKVFSGEIFDVYQWKQKMFDGKYETFEMLKRADTVAVIPTTSDGKIILEINEQPNREKKSGFPAGAVEDSNNVDLEALRELKEETGYVPMKLKLWKDFQATSKIDWWVYFFIGQGCKKVSEPKADSGEKVKVQLVTFEEFLEMVKTKKFNPKDFMYEFLRACYDKKDKEELKKMLFE